MKASLVQEFHLNNKMFDISDPNVNRDNMAYPFYLLKKQLAMLGVDLSTCDLHPPALSDICIYHDIPKKLPAMADKYKNLLLLMESDLVRPTNRDLSAHAYFSKILTWNDSLIDNQTYFKLNYAHQLPTSIPRNRRERFCTLIAGNKYIHHPLELYSKRVAAIRWFERHHPADFEFYGFGWRHCPPGLSAFPIGLRHAFPALFGFQSYRGSVQTKHAILKQYRFAICFENAHSLPGYITEKIFDCMLAGCIPVYWGAPNITQHIPAACFIDFRQFSSYDALYQYLTTMEDATYQSYLNAIETFITSDAAVAFSCERFVETIIGVISGVNIVGA